MTARGDECTHRRAVIPAFFDPDGKEGIIPRAALAGIFPSQRRDPDQFFFPGLCHCARPERLYRNKRLRAEHIDASN